MRITKSRLRELIVESICSSGEQSHDPKEDSEYVREVFNTIKQEFITQFGSTDSKLAQMLERTNFIIVTGPDDPNYRKATAHKGELDAVFRYIDNRIPSRKMDVSLRKKLHSQGKHNTIYYFLYGSDPEDEYLCIDSDLVNTTIRHELAHFVDVMSTFVDEGRRGFDIVDPRRSDQLLEDGAFDDLIDNNIWTSGGGWNENGLDIFADRWFAKGGYGSAFDSLNLTEEEEIEELVEKWDELQARWATYKEIYARVWVMNEQVFIPLDISLADIVKMSMSDLIDAESQYGNIIPQGDLIKLALIVRQSCPDKGECTVDERSVDGLDQWW